MNEAKWGGVLAATAACACLPRPLVHGAADCACAGVLMAFAALSASVSCDFWAVLQEMSPDFAMGSDFWVVLGGCCAAPTSLTWENAGAVWPFGLNSPAKPPRSREWASMALQVARLVRRLPPLPSFRSRPGSLRAAPPPPPPLPAATPIAPAALPPLPLRSHRFARAPAACVPRSHRSRRSRRSRRAVSHSPSSPYSESGGKTRLQSFNGMG